MRYYIYFLAIICLSISGCAHTISESEFEAREYKRAENVEKWALCQRVYRNTGIPTYSNHLHLYGRSHRYYEVTEDLRLNKCHQILKQLEIWD